MERFILFAALLAGVSCVAGTANATNESQAAVLFLLIEPGAKQAAMGEAYSAVADDATAGYYNPAGLAFQDRKKKNLQLMHTNWLPKLADDMYYKYLGYSQYAKGWGHFAFNMVYFNQGEQARTNSLSPEIIGKFNSFELMASGSYGVAMTNHLSLGFTLKYIYSKLADAGQEAEKGKGIGNSFALDFGAMYKPPIMGLTLSAVVHNIGQKISYIVVTQADPLPLHFVAGASYIPIDDKYARLTFALDAYKPLVMRNASPVEALIRGWYDEPRKEEFEQIDYKVGGEIMCKNMFENLIPMAQQYGGYWPDLRLALRAGYTYDKDGELKSPTCGLGITCDWLSVNIAYYAACDNPMQDSWRFDAAFNF